jgi:hypothetical protein
LQVLLASDEFFIHCVYQIPLLSTYHFSHIVHNLVNTLILLLKLLEKCFSLCQHLLFCFHIAGQFQAGIDLIDFLNWHDAIILVFGGKIFVDFRPAFIKGAS